MTGAARELALAKRCATPLSDFICPARRGVGKYPQTWNRFPLTDGGAFTEPLHWVAKTDYAANVGHTKEVEFSWRWPGPQSLGEGDSPAFDWPDTQMFQGVVFGRSRIRRRHLKDGATKTYLFGEKYMNRLHYRTGEDWGDNESLFTGFNNDSCRSAQGRPLRDRPGIDRRTRFGSAHAEIWHAVFCDSTVRSLRYDLRLKIHQQYSNRADGHPTMRPMPLQRRSP